MSSLATSPVAEAAVLERWLYDRLTGSAALEALVGGNVYRAPAPDPLEDIAAELLEDTAVVFQYLSGLDTLVVGTTRVLARDLYVVKAVGPRHVDVAAVANVLELELADARGAQDGLSIAAERAGTVNYPEPTKGRLYDHLGATWRLEIA